MVQSAQRTAVLELIKESFKFSAGHFTLFSATEREDLHGHDFNVEVRLEAPVGSDGLCFDYRGVKAMIRDLCASLDEKVLLPAESPWLELDRLGSGGWSVTFAGETFTLLERDVLVLPLANVSLEELARWFLATLREELARRATPLGRLEIGVGAGPGQRAWVAWTTEEGAG